MAITERLKVNVVQGENMVQTIVRGQIEVPATKPNIEKVLSTETTAKVREVNIVPDKVIINGILTLQVTYVAFEADQSVHSMHGDVNFTTFVDLPGAEPGMDFDVDFSVEDISLTPSKNNACALDVTAVLGVFAKVMDIRVIEVLVQTPEGNEALETQDITVEHMIDDKAIRQVIISDSFEIPYGKPDVEKILSVKADVEITDKRVIAGKVIVDGKVTVDVLYVSLTPEQSVHDLHSSFTFSDFLEVPEAQPDMNVCVRAEVESAEIAPISCPKILADVIIKLTAYVSETRTIEDIPVLLRNETGFEQIDLKIDREIGTGEVQVVLRENVELPQAKPDVMRVLEARVDNTKITESNIINGKVLIRGYADVEVVYVSALPNQSVHAMHKRLNFRTFVEITDAEQGMRTNVKVTPEYVNVEQISCDLHMEVVLKVRVNVTDLVNLRVYVAEETESTECEPTTYIVQSGDTLSSIAASMGTTVDIILADNPQITNRDEISIGQELKITCAPLG